MLVSPYLVWGLTIESWCGIRGNYPAVFVDFLGLLLLARIFYGKSRKNYNEIFFA